MEKWQAEHITENRPQLLGYIECDASFSSYLQQFGVLTDVEANNLNAIGMTKGDYEKTYSLLNILRKKERAYEHLCKALYNCKQTGALLTLLDGIERNVADQNPFQYCGIEVNADDVLSMDVLVEGVCRPLKHVYLPLDSSQLKQIITRAFDSNLYEQLLSQKPLSLVVSSIPESLTYYVPRNVSVSNKLGPLIFDQLTDDIFCIEGIELHQLSALSKRKRISARSRNQTRKVTAGFILLEHRQHFQAIARLTAKPVHWVKQDNGSYFHIKSVNGDGVNRTQPFLNSNDAETFREDQFVDRCLDAPPNAPVLLYDSPGMGKSVLLAQLARLIKQKRPDRTVIYTQFPDLIKQMSHFRGRYSASAVTESLLKIVTTNKLGLHLLQNLVEAGNHGIELFLDAYDEVHEADISAANKILCCIANECKNIRMFVTTRPHRRHELEGRFGVVGYNILPFNQDNKMSFFRDYWRDVHMIQVNDEIERFAEHCLEILRSAMPSDKGDIAGIPLQCKMLADIYVEDAKYGGLISTESDLQFDSIFQMYRKFMELKFASFGGDEKRFLLNFHMKEAIRVIFSEEITIPGEELSVVDRETVYRVGILQPSKYYPETFAFVHRTFAEFLAAQYIITYVIKEQIPTDTILQNFNLLFEKALSVSAFTLSASRHQYFHLAFVLFLNFLLSEMYSLCACSTTVKTCLQTSTFYRSSALFGLLESTLTANAVHLFKFLLNVYFDLETCEGTSEGLFKLNKSLRDHPEYWTRRDGKTQHLMVCLKDEIDLIRLITAATEYSSLELVTITEEFVESLTRRKCNQFSGYGNAIRASLKRGHYQIFDYILDFDKYNSFEKPLVCWCLEGSLKNSPEVIIDKVEILKKILQEKPGILHKYHKEYQFGPLLTYEAHPKLLQYLIEAGADLTSIDANDENIAQRVAEHFSADQYHQFLILAISRNAKMIFKQRRRDRLTPIHLALKKIELKTETLELLKDQCGVTFNDNDNWLGKSELAYAIDKGRSRRVINDILRVGGDTENMNNPQSILISDR